MPRSPLRSPLAQHMHMHPYHAYEISCRATYAYAPLPRIACIPFIDGTCTARTSLCSARSPIGASPVYLPLLWRSQIPTSFYSAGAAMAATRPTSLPTSSLRPDDQSLEDPNDSHAPRPSVTPSRPHDADDDGGGSSDVHSEGRARGAGDTNDASIATTLATSRLRGEQRSLRHGLRLGSPNISPNISVPRGEWRLYEDRPGKWVGR